MAIRGEGASTYRPAKGFSITAIAAARRVGGAIALPISIWVSSTTVTILRMTALISAFPIKHLPKLHDAGAREGHAYRRRAFRPSAAAPRLRSGPRRAGRARSVLRL